MGLFGKLFEKKECSVCGGEIGFLGNRKLEDGNLCKHCAAKLSPLFSERRHSTVEEIKAQLLYREENQRQIGNFRPNVSFGIGGKKIYVDEAQGKFIVTRAGQSRWSEENPDIIGISQVTGCNIDIQEHRNEIYYKDKEGNNKSYNPPRYEYEYEFRADIDINSPWFDDAYIELSEGKRPESRYSPEYCDLEYQLNALASVLRGQGMPTNMRNGAMGGFGAARAQQGFVQQTQYAQPQQNSMQTPSQGSWVCNMCGASNEGKFCQGCGAQKPSMNISQNSWTCICGTENTGRFCQNCGSARISPEDI